MTFFSQARRTCGTTHFIRPCTIWHATDFGLPPYFEDWPLYSQTCIKRSPLYSQTCIKRSPLNSQTCIKRSHLAQQKSVFLKTGGCLVTALGCLTIHVWQYTIRRNINQLNITQFDFYLFAFCFCAFLILNQYMYFMNHNSLLFISYFMIYFTYNWSV